MHQNNKPHATFNHTAHQNILSENNPGHLLVDRGYFI